MAKFLSESRVRSHLREVLSRRLFLRFHITLLLFWTFGTGLLTTKLLLMLGVESMLVRYPVAVLMAWLAFLLGVRVWLWYAGYRVRDAGPSDLNLNLPDIDLASSGGKATEIFRGGGGSFGGGGASSSFTVNNSAIAASEVPQGGDGAGRLVESAVDAVGSMFKGAADADEGAVPLLVVVLVLAVLAILFVGVAYAILGGPEILVEAMFQAMLAGDLLHKVRRSEPGDWSGAVVRLTWKPALAMLGVAVGFALAVQHWLPQVHSLTELLAVLLAG